MVVFFVILCGANETSEFSFGGGFSSSIFFSISKIQSGNNPQNCQNRLN